MINEWPLLSPREANVSLIDCDHRTPPASSVGYPRSAEFREFTIQSMTGSSRRQRVPQDSLPHFRVSEGSKSVATMFGRIVKPLFARASAAGREGRADTVLRDTLLPKLISGELSSGSSDKARSIV